MITANVIKVSFPFKDGDVFGKTFRSLLRLLESAVIIQTLSGSLLNLWVLVFDSSRCYHYLFVCS